jgi:hypothetical protein
MIANVGEYYEQLTSVPDKVLFIRDSWMYHYGNRVHSISASSHQMMSSIWVTAPCCFFPDTTSSCGLPVLECKQAVQTFWDIVIHKKQYKIKKVVYSQYWYGHSTPEDEKKIAKFLKSIRSAGLEIEVILPHPTGPKFDPHNMIARHLLKPFELITEPVPAKDIEEDRSHIVNFFRRQQKILHIALIDPVKTSCSAGMCLVVSSEGIPLLMDGHHIGSAATSAGSWVDETVTVSPVFNGVK